MNPVYYNDHDPYCAAWLRNLIAAGHLPAGEVDERSITAIEPGDLQGFHQCHFFAGIGGWAYALRLVGWPDARPVWTGSCPCQPFSVAGHRKGDADERHLWPAFRRLIGECAPAIVFGEQVAGSDGRQWLAGVRLDLEALGYAVGAADLCAAGVGAPHIRQRLFWVADANGRQSGDRDLQRGWQYGQQSEDGCAFVGLADAGRKVGEGRRYEQLGFSNAQESQGACSELGGCGWGDFDVVICADQWPDGTNKARRIESGSFPLAHGISARVGKLRAYGNAIVPQVAAEVIRAIMAIRPTTSNER